MTISFPICMHCVSQGGDESAMAAEEAEGVLQGKEYPCDSILSFRGQRNCVGN